MPDPKEIERRFTYHSPEGKSEVPKAIWDKAKELATMINGMCPESREKSLALTKLEDVAMRAERAIALNGERTGSKCQRT